MTNPSPLHAPPKMVHITGKIAALLSSAQLGPRPRPLAHSPRSTRLRYRSGVIRESLRVHCRLNYLELVGQADPWPRLPLFDRLLGSLQGPHRISSSPQWPSGAYST